MSDDNNNLHKVVTDALQTLGTIIDASAGRDAIHVAVEPAVAGDRLRPGQHVSLKLVEALDMVVAVPGGDTVGIVDPFLREPVGLGDHFWLLVYPRQITSLRHVWSHPKFDGK